MNKTAIYMRVSTGHQSTASQRPDIERWLELSHIHPDDQIWLEDTASGRSRSGRPQYYDLERLVSSGNIERVVVWRVDRLGRSMIEACKFFQLCKDNNVNIISVSEGIDNSTELGELITNIMASFAQYEADMRAERIRAGISAARRSNCPECKVKCKPLPDPRNQYPKEYRYKCNVCGREWKGKKWGGSRKGRRTKLTDAHVKAINSLAMNGMKAPTIAKTQNISISTVYRALRMLGHLPELPSSRAM